MMISLGPTPCNEKCAQVGEANYEVRAKEECKAYIGQLKRVIAKAIQMKELPLGTVGSFLIKGEKHEFGTYYEVYVGENKAGQWIEENLPEDWDDQAKEELGLII